MKRSTVFLAAVVCCAIVSAGAGYAGAEGKKPPRTSMTAKEFDALPDADKRAVLIDALQERERAVRNLRASSVTHVYNVGYRDGKTGEVVDDMARYVCQLRRKDGSHWASIDWFQTKQPDRPLVKVVTALDAKSGEARSVAQHAQLKGVYGAIDKKEDEMIKCGHFHYLFEASFDKLREFPISYLLKQQAVIKFEGLSGEGKEIQISIHVETRNGTPFQETRTVWIDPQRGFMPVRMHDRWEYETQPPLWSEIDTDVKKMRQIDGVWFPTHFTETVIGRLSVSQNWATVYETTADRIKLGTVTDDDLYVPFDIGVEVHDRIKGVRFVVGKTPQ